ncbi:MAG TPA: ribosome small subunit-dependent GTPase A [Gemmataceae bacterium]|nr:ribosome small subunit-dependent GTPase A [Gemmataceae bacterium]
MAKKKKVRVDLRKNRSKPPRPRQWTRDFQDHGFAEEATTNEERVRAKGELSRRRTIIQEDTDASAAGQEPAEMPAVDASTSLLGRVLRVHGLFSIVQTDDGRQYRCVVRRLLRTLATHERNIVATGDRVWVRPSESSSATVSGERGCVSASSDDLGVLTQPRSPLPEGWIERIEPRHGLLTRASRGREQVLVANVDQVVFVMSLVEPELKPHLIDRYLASAEQGGIRPILCLNKADLVDPARYQPLVGLYSQLDVPTLLTSAAAGTGIERLRERLRHRETVFSGQSGVGKSSLLNAIQPGLGLRVREVSEGTRKGRHTTTAAELIRLDFGGWVVDTPGVRQFQLWDLLPQEIEGFFAEFRPFVHLCGYPDCTHTHEDRCAIKRAVARRQISFSRYTSYLGMFAGEDAS